MSATTIATCELCRHNGTVYLYQDTLLCLPCFDATMRSEEQESQRVEPDKCLACDGQRDANCPYCRGGKGIL